MGPEVMGARCRLAPKGADMRHDLKRPCDYPASTSGAPEVTRGGGLLNHG